MNRMELETLLRSVKPLDEEAMKAASEYQDLLIKPTGSLGSLEEISIRLAGITGKVKNQIEKTAVAIFSSDNGVAAQGVASAPQDITYTQTMNFQRKVTGVGALASAYGTDLLVYDMGGVRDYPEDAITDEPVEDGKLTEKIVDRKIAYGTKDLSQGPAMTEDELCQAMFYGIEAARAISYCGYDAFGIGEMGIGNTTTSAAVLSALAGLTAEETVGKGGGINRESFLRKKEIVDSAAARVRNQDAFEALMEAGGFDLAAMTGAFLGAGIYQIPVVIDGYISAVAALCAYLINPDVKGYLFASHKSTETGYHYAMDKIGLKPMFDLGMRLGEGSGCPIAFQIMKGACGVICSMGTFAESEVDKGYLDELDREEDF